MQAVSLAVVRYHWPEWYVRLTLPDGRTRHSEPWLSEMAARYCERIWRWEWGLSTRTNDLGDGDPCPDGHGKMYVLPGSNPPQQWCAHQSHDGVWTREGKTPPTRNRWPLHGFEESAAAHRARLDRDAKLASDIDLSAMEVTA